MKVAPRSRCQAWRVRGLESPRPEGLQAWMQGGDARRGGCEAWRAPGVETRDCWA